MRIDLKNHLESLKHYGAEVNHTGSTYICDPAPQDTDIDYLVFCPSDKSFNNVRGYLKDNLFELDAGEHYDDPTNNTFISYSFKPINFIVTKDKGFAERHRTATEACKQLNILDKKYRIQIFKAILYKPTISDDEVIF